MSEIIPTPEEAPLRTEDRARLARLRSELEAELTGGILPFWETRTPDAQRGGFVGRIDQDGAPDPEAPKGAILTARIVWTFSAAHRAYGEPRHLELARHGMDFLNGSLWDAEYGGYRWSVEPDGAPRDERKHVYANAFCIYALTEYYHASGDAAALTRALDVYRAIERCAVDAAHNGYGEAFARDWSPLADARLSAQDVDAPKSQNTHLHLLEAYTALYRAWTCGGPEKRLGNLVELFLDRIIDPSGAHLNLFFAQDWGVVGAGRSFGHDIEASWLLTEAAGALPDEALRARVAAAARALANSVLRDGCDADGGILNGRTAGGTPDAEKHWWPQAEAIVGFLNAYALHPRRAYLEAALGAWRFVQDRLLDKAHGEWRWGVDRAGAPLPGMDKVGFWKCPYHNARGCLEGIRRIDALTDKAA